MTFALLGHRLGIAAREARGRTCAALVALLVGSGLACGPETPASPARSATPSVFDAERAFADLRDMVALGPRPTGSLAAARTRELMSGRLRQAGWRVQEHAFTATPPLGEPVEMVNLIATLPAASAGGDADAPALLLGAHYDTKRFDRRFVGANDGASGVAVLLELARWLGRSEPRMTLHILLFDGEEAFGPSITARDGLYGSAALAEKLDSEGVLARTRALLLVDMVADRDLNLGVDLNSAPELLRIFREEGGDLIDESQTLNLIDDHIPFRQRGLDQVLALIDFQFGDRSSPGPLWHTPGDDLSSVSAESLGRVGDLMVRLIRRLGAVAPPENAARRPRPAANRHATRGAAEVMVKGSRRRSGTGVRDLRAEASASPAAATAGTKSPDRRLMAGDSSGPERVARSRGAAVRAAAVAAGAREAGTRKWRLP